MKEWENVVLLTEILLNEHADLICSTKIQSHSNLNLMNQK